MKRIDLPEIAKLNWFGPVFPQMMQDFRQAARTARKNKGSTLAAFLALSIGMGGATAIFSAVNAVMLRPLPVKDGDRVVRIFATDSSSNKDDVSMADYLDWRRQLRTFSAMTIFRTGQATLAGGATPERVVTIETESTLLPLLGVVPIRGRNFLAAENQPGHASEAILTWPFWQSHFGGGSALGRKLMLDEKPYTIVGILPKNFTLLGHRDILVPLPFDLKAAQNQRGYHAYTVFARLSPGVTINQATAQLAAISASLATAFPNQNKGVSAKAVKLIDSLQGEGVGSAQTNFRPALLLLLAAILCVLLIACGNVTNLHLVRVRSRRQEIAVRLAMGAGRAHLFQHIIIESLLLSLSATVAGVTLAYALVRLFDRLSLAEIPRLEETSVDLTALLFALVVGILAGLVSAVVPALRSDRLDLNSALKEGGQRTTESRTEQQLRRLFVALETGLAAVLLIECGLFTESFVKVAEINPHFETDHLLTAYLALPSSRYGIQNLDRARLLVQDVLDRLRVLPGVASAAATSDLPLTGTAAGGGILVEGQAIPARYWEAPYAVQAEVSPQFFRTLKVRFVAGADFDYSHLTEKVAIVNQALVRKLFSNRDPLGKRIALASDKSDWRRIVGVVADVPQTTIEEQAAPELFFPMARLNARWVALVVRVTGDPLSYLDTVRRNVAQIDPSVAVFLPRTMDQIMRKQLEWRALQTWVVGSFAFLAVALSSLGVYAVIAYSVGQRRSEIGLRLALGASAADIRRLIVWQGIKPASIGAILGLLCGFVLARASSSLLFGVKADNPTVYASAVILLLLVSGLASLLPAIRAAATEPAKALRHE